MAGLAKIANSELTLSWLKLDKLFLYMFLSVEDIVPIQFESIVRGFCDLAINVRKESPDNSSGNFLLFIVIMHFLRNR